MNGTHVRLLSLVLGSLAVACGGEEAPPTEPPEPPKPKTGLEILAHSRTTDTVLASILEPITIEYRSASGQLQEGVRIEFTSIPEQVGSASQLRAFLGPRFGVYGYFPHYDTTDASGRATAYVRLADRSGSAHISVYEFASGTTDTITFTILPGNVRRIRFTPGDTMLTVGARARVSAVATDFLNNPRTEVVTLSVSSGGQSGVLGGDSLRAVGTGTIVVRGAVGTVSDSMRVGVVPAGRLAFTQARAHTSDSVRVFLINTDLSGRRMLEGPSSLELSERTPAWSPNGDRLVVQIGRFNERLFFVDTATGALTRVIQYTTTYATEHAAQYTKDGQWIYFDATPTHQDRQLWRVRPDGSGASLIGLPGDWYDIDATPSPSPDGTRVVYHTNRTYRDSGRPMLMLLNVATRDTTGLKAGGINPRWSPTGTEIVYIENGALKLIRPDGTGQRVIGVQTGGYTGYPLWSPDGEWVVANGATSLHLIRVSTGEIVFYPVSSKSMTQVAWRP